MEANWTRARMGLFPPTLSNSARTASASASGWIALNLAAMTSRASTTFGVVIYLSSNEAWSSALFYLSYSS